MSVPVRKISGAWWVEERDLERALLALREEMSERHAATVDYKNKVLRGGRGESVETDWGRYTIRGSLRDCTLSRVFCSPCGTSTEI
jgi:hypothetical protein